MTNSRILMVVAVALLAAVAIFALARKNEVASQPFLNPASAPIVPASNFAGSSGEMPWYASRPAVRTIEQPPPPRPVVQTYTEAPSRHHHHEVVRKRKTKHSVAIVAGSAGMGAAIGALAGGGKGAGIGALAGGTGGFVYDRLTHKRRVEY